MRRRRRLRSEPATGSGWAAFDGDAVWSAAGAALAHCRRTRALVGAHSADGPAYRVVGASAVWSGSLSWSGAPAGARDAWPQAGGHGRRCPRPDVRVRRAALADPKFGGRRSVHHGVKGRRGHHADTRAHPVTGSGRGQATLCVRGDAQTVTSDRSDVAASKAATGRAKRGRHRPGPGHRRVAVQGEDDRRLPRAPTTSSSPRSATSATCRATPTRCPPRTRTSRGPGSASTSTTTSSRSTSSRRTRRPRSPS